MDERLFLIVFLLVCGGNASQSPEQVHISLTGDLTEMFITWLTMDPVNAPAFVNYGISKDVIGRMSATTEKFTDLGEKRIVRYVYRAKLTNLQPDTTYYYKVGTDLALSQVFSFKTFPKGDFPLRICIFGDLGMVNGQFQPLIQGAEKDLFDMVIHVGDFAYDLQTDNGNCGDDFFRKIEPITSKIPYMAVVGNHEQPYDFLHYKMRFTMPENGTPRKGGFFYSFDAGSVHFTGLSSEYYAQNDLDAAKDQFDWLVKDLKATKQPWKISYLHRPIYCSNNKPGWDDGDCNDVTANRIRLGGDGYPGLEDAFKDNKVDIVFYGHMHSYERMWPVYDKTVFREGQQADLYCNPETPVHVITGSAGCHTPHTPQDSNVAWSCARSEDFGFTVLEIHNSSHIHLRQYSTEQQKDVDQMWLVKTSEPTTTPTTVSSTPTTTVPRAASTRIRPTVTTATTSTPNTVFLTTSPTKTSQKSLSTTPEDSTTSPKSGCTANPTPTSAGNPTETPKPKRKGTSRPGMFLAVVVSLVIVTLPYTYELL